MADKTTVLGLRYLPDGSTGSGSHQLQPSDWNSLLDYVEAVYATGTLGNVTIPTITATTGNITTVNSTTENATTVNAGADGTAGIINLYAPGAAKGHVAWTMGNQTGNTTISVTFADQAGNRTLTVPAASANCSYVLTAATTQDITGNLSATTLQGNTTVSAGKDASAGTISIYPATTASGHVNITASNAAGNTTTVYNVAAQAGNRTYTLPDAKGNGTMAMTRGSDLWIGDIYQCSGNLTKNANTTYADIPGLTGLNIDVGTYRFSARVAVSTGATPGAKLAFNYTTAVLSAIESTGIGTVNGASPVLTHTTTTTTQTDLLTGAAAFGFMDLEGTFTVSTAGTLALQGAQNTSNGSNTIFLVGSTLELIRIS